MKDMKKFIAEAIGTAILVIVGCGTAMLVGCDSQAGCGYLLTALAFGLAIVACAYSIGNISGCHVNPAVSLAVFMTGQMERNTFIGYVISQIIGAFVGTGLLSLVFNLGEIADMTGAYGANGLDGVSGSVGAGLIVEFILTFIFVLAILGVTSAKAGHGSMAGLVIGLTLVLVHILGIGLTGTSVNPARSIAPAIVAGGDALSSLWVFIVGPLAGAAAAAAAYKGLDK